MTARKSRETRKTFFLFDLQLFSEILKSYCDSVAPCKKGNTMATIIKRLRRNGSVALLVRFYVHKQRKEISFSSKYTRGQVEEYARFIERLSISADTGSDLDRKTAAFIQDLPDEVAEKLQSVGLIATTRRLTLGELWEACFDSLDCKWSTIKTYQSVEKRFFRFFNRDALADLTTKESVSKWLLWCEHSEGYAEATVAGCHQRASAVFNWAVKHDVLSKNPFNGVPRPSFVNEASRLFIPVEWYQLLLEACPDQTWRTLLSLCRFGGLRNPSETLLLRWEDVDWDRRRLLIHSPKTEHHIGKSERVIPIFPEIMVELERQFEEADEGGSPFVIAKPSCRSSANLRTQFKRIIFRAGLDPWPTLFQNLRRSRDIELSRDYPAFVAAAWMGHSPTVAAKHYLFPTDGDFARATGDAKTCVTYGVTKLALNDVK